MWCPVEEQEEKQVEESNLCVEDAEELREYTSCQPGVGIHLDHSVIWNTMDSRDKTRGIHQWSKTPTQGAGAG